jgi:hypothetical protein
MVQSILYRRLREGQTKVLTLALDGPVTRTSLDSNGLKVALFSLERYGLVDKRGQITEVGRTALKAGKYPIEQDPLEAIFLANVRALQEVWKLKRMETIYRAVALAVKAVRADGQPLARARLAVKEAQDWIDRIGDSGPAYIGELDEAEEAYLGAADYFFELYDKQKGQS